MSITIWVSALLLLFFDFPADPVAVEVIKDNGKIHWNADRKLSWPDFKGSPVESSKFSAESSLQISYGMKISQDSRGTKVSYNIDCYFEPKESWVKVKMKTNSLLKHEQVHFDIAEIFARKLQKRFRATSFTIDNYNTKSQDIFNRTFSEYQNFQAAYDHDTVHGSDKAEQVNWENNIASMLKKSERYKK